jgi:hypothetical protein
LVDAVGYQSLVDNNPTLDFQNVVAGVLINRRVPDLCIIGAHARAEEIQRPKSIANLFFEGCDKVEVVLSLAVFVPGLPKSKPMLHE